MSIFNLLFRKKFLVSFLLIIFVSITLHFFPLIGSLGYEFSVISSFVISFFSVFISSELLNDYQKNSSFARVRIEDVVYSVLFVNFLMLMPLLISGIVGSSLNGFCYFREGLIFFLLITVVSTFFSTALGSFCGYIFKSRGFIVSSLIIILIIFYSLAELYYKPHLFFYNPILGYFPGPIYDRVIPIDNTLIIYRILVAASGLFLFKFIQILPGFRNYKFGLHNVVLMIFLLVIVLFGFNKREELGFTHSGEFIIENYLTKAFETEHFLIYYSPYEETSKIIDLIAEDHEWRYYQLKEFLEIKSDKKIRSFIYPDEKTRKKLIGAGDTTIANPINGEIHLVYDSFPLNVLKHELVHVMSAEFGSRVLKISPKYGLVEGLAVASDWDIDGISRHKLSKNLIESGGAPDIKEILGIGFWYSSGEKSYTLMGSFCRFLVDTYGITKFKEFYRTGKTEIYGKSLDDLISDWKKFLKGIKVNKKEKELSTYRFTDKGLFGGYCPREVESLKVDGMNAYNENKLKLASKYFDQAAGIDRNNPDLITFLAYTNYYDGNIKEFNSIIESDKNINATNKNIFENLKANIIWKNGDYDSALKKFIQLKNKSLPADILREIDIKIFLENFDSRLKNAFAYYFTTKDKIAKLGILTDIIQSYPDFSPAYYLLGRIYYNNSDYDRASKYFFYSYSLGLPTANLATENLNLLGISHYLNKRYNLALETFEQKLLLNPNGDSSGFTMDFIRRINWTIAKSANNREG